MSYVTRFVLISLVFFSSLGYSKQLGEIQQQLARIEREFLILGSKLPFQAIDWRDAVRGSEDKVRAQYEKANQQLERGILLLTQTATEEGHRTLTEAYHRYRVVGLLMPFYANEELINSWLKNQDYLGQSIRELSNVSEPVPPPPAQAWIYGGFLWVHVGRMALDQGRASCAALRISSEVPAVPDFQQLAGVYVDMKDPQKNQVFGDKARTFGRVWTSTPTENNNFTFVDFQQNASGSAPASEEMDVVCATRAR